MALEAPADPISSSNTSWFKLSLLIYGWADRRDSAVDRAWWRAQRYRTYGFIGTSAEVPLGASASFKNLPESQNANV